MLAIAWRRGVFAPVIVCDHCAQEIEDAKDGNYQWWMDLKRPDERDAPIFFTHKACCDPFEKSRGRLSETGCWGSEELRALPVYLSSNLRIDTQKARAYTRVMASLS